MVPPAKRELLLVQPEALAGVLGVLGNDRPHRKDRVPDIAGARVSTLKHSRDDDMSRQGFRR